MAKLTFELFRSAFEEKVKKYAVTFEAVGFFTPDKRIYPFGTDTKVISTVFEALAGPLIREIADEQGYEMEGSEQTIYPDFTVTPKAGGLRTAIDIKTTYRKFSNGRLQPFKYTLGSFTSFLRTDGAAKNIKYPYAEYENHWVLGFLYTRKAGVQAKVYYRPEEITQAACPYQDVEYFVQEKYKIVGESPASGNTANIGSFPTNNIDDLRHGRGPFATHGKAVCDRYWRYYGKKAAEREYKNIIEFLQTEYAKEAAQTAAKVITGA